MTPWPEIRMQPRRLSDSRGRARLLGPVGVAAVLPQLTEQHSRLKHEAWQVDPRAVLWRGIDGYS